MVQLVATAVGALAMLAWLSATLHALLLLPHRREEHSLVALAFQGWRFYARDTWKESGHALHRRFLASTLAFFLVVIAGIALGALAASMA